MHCIDGRSRAATVVIAYLVEWRGLSVPWVKAWTARGAEEVGANGKERDERTPHVSTATRTPGSVVARPAKVDEALKTLSDACWSVL